MRCCRGVAHVIASMFDAVSDDGVVIGVLDMSIDGVSLLVLVSLL